MKPILALSAVALLCGGCAHTYTITSISRSGVLRANASALVALPEDGHFEKNSYPGSGRTTGLAVSAAFARHLQRVDSTPETAALAVQLDKARAAKSDYLIVPTVVHWEDRATEWSGRPDRIEIEIRTVDAPSGETLALGSVKGKSKWATLGGDSPEDLLATPIEAYVGWLFSPVGTPPPLKIDSVSWPK
jgi:Domain of unknown function (DUF4823)